MSENNMKRLGDYIRPVDVRNRDLKVTRLLGVSITKEFMPSIANIVGTDLSAYKVVTKGQFAYGPVTSRNGDKISVALLDGYDDAIISQAYTVFEVVDTNALDPEYLMMWFRRPEFDRYARFHSHGSAREVFDWEEMCEVQVPVPAIEKQREIVAEYNTLATRIETNKKLIATLEQSAQTLYIEHIENKKQKKCLLKDLCGFQEGYVNPSQECPEYFGGDVKWLRANDVNGGFIFETSRTLTKLGFESAGSSALLFEPQTLVITKSGTIGRLGILCDYMCGNRAVINIKPFEKLHLPFIFFYLKNKYNDLVDMAVGSAQANLYVPVLAALEVYLPDYETMLKYCADAGIILNAIKNKAKDCILLEQMQTLLLSKMGV